jgi:hypothetical protein
VFLEVLFLRRLAYLEHAAIDERRLSEISVVGPDKYCTARPQALNVIFGLACTQKAVEYFLGFILIDHFGHHYRAVRTGVVNAYLEAHGDHSLRSNAPEASAIAARQSFDVKEEVRSSICLLMKSASSEPD